MSCWTPRRITGASLFLLPMATSLGCTENAIVAQPYDAVAVVAGDFDSVQLNLGRLDVAHAIYEGFIAGPAYEDGVDPQALALKSETLFTYVDDGGRAEISRQDAVFINSGARGFGEYTWNGVEADDQFLSDPAALANIADFVEADGRTLIVSDWSYDIIEALWPERVQFYGDEDDADGSPFDAAQVGSAGKVTATLTNDGLKTELGAETMSVDFNYTNWALVESVASDVEVYATADVSYRVSETEGYADITGVPLLFSFEAGQGRVIFSSFHWNTQTPGLSDTLLVSMVDQLDLGSGSEQAAEETGDSGE